MQMVNPKYSVLKVLSASVLLLGHYAADAQLPPCVPDNSGGIIYFINSSEIYNWNPALPFSATNPTLNTIAVPGSTYNIAVSSNLNNPAGPSPTFYVAAGATVDDATYRYYDGAAWVNTGHLSASVNIGGGATAIYGLDVSNTNGTIRKYTGTGNATALIDIPDLNYGGPADVQGEAGTSNFYILRVNAPGWLRKYDGNGNMLYQWDVTYGGANGGGSGFAILNGMLYAKTNDGLYSGAITTTGINLLPVPGAPFSLTGSNDMAACFPGIVTPPPAFHDTVYMCSAAPVTISSPGTGAFSYTVLSGAPAITGNGPDYFVTTTTLSTVIIEANNAGNVRKDTFTIVPAYIADAGMDDTLAGCGVYSGTLNAAVTNTQPWINYTYSWTPAATITAGITTLTPDINPTGVTIYILNVATDNEHGNCVVTDSVTISVKNESVIADFSYQFTGNCASDSVLFTNLSQNAAQYFWDLGDGNISTSENPVHLYNNEGVYNVKLRAVNAICKDSVIKVVDNTNNLAAAFTTDADTICQGGNIVFTNTSAIQHTPVNYSWAFGDGAVSAATDPVHTYPIAGSYEVRLIVSDAISCFDTVIRTVVVDSVAAIHLEKSADNICAGRPVHFETSVTGTGLTELTWNSGNGTVVSNDYSLTHAYDEAGNYDINIKAVFRACPEVGYNDKIIVHPLPLANIGPDTAICLHGDPIVLANSAPSDAAYSYAWNTGDTTSFYTAVHPGVYTLTVTNQYGCSAADDVTVNKDCYIDIPNAFTPNNDGVDDYFLPRQLLSAGAVGFVMQVFNRWGQIVFETNTPDGRGWDGKFNGKDQPQGVYIYRIEAIFKNARTEKHTGNLTLLR